MTQERPEFANMPAAQTLLSEPVELTEAIINELTNKDVFSVRLVCHELRDRAERLFVNKFFTSRRHVITAHSLRSLVAITGSPRLRKKLRCIILDLTELSDQYLLRALAKKGTKVQQEQCGTMWKAWTIMRPECGLLQDLLSEALGNLVSAGVRPSFGIAEMSVNSFACLQKSDRFDIYGLATFAIQVAKAADRNPRLLELKSGDPVNAMTMLLTAIAQAHFPLRGLIMQVSDGISFLPFQLPPPLPSHLIEAFTSLEYLEWDMNFDSPLSGLEAAVQVFRKAARLQNLQLSCWIDESSARVAQLMEAFSNCPLMDVSLSGFCTLNDTQDFLDSHRGTLKRLCLDHLILENGTHDWINLLHWMSSNLTLLHTFSASIHLATNGSRDDVYMERSLNNPYTIEQDLIDLAVSLEPQSDVSQSESDDEGSESASGYSTEDDT